MYFPPYPLKKGARHVLENSTYFIVVQLPKEYYEMHTAWKDITNYAHSFRPFR